MSKKNLANVPVPRSELNTPAMHDESKLRDDRCVPVAQFILRAIAKQADIPLGSHVHQEKAEDHYLQTIRDTIEHLANSNTRVSDVIYIFGLCREALQIVQEGVSDTINNNFDRISEAVYGIEQGKSDQIGVGDLAKVVKHGAKIKDNWKLIIEE